MNFTEILINKTDNHNKFYGYKVENGSNVLKTYWGRVGTNGNSNEETFGDEHTAQMMGKNKIREKFSKGYQIITEAEYELLKFEAQIIGSNHKVNKSYMVILEGDTFKSIKDQTEINKPGVKVGVFLQVVDAPNNKTYNILADESNNFIFERDEKVWFSTIASTHIKITSKKLLTSHPDYNPSDKKNLLNKIQTNISKMLEVVIQKHG